MELVISLGIISLIFLLLSKTIFSLFLPKNDWLCLLISTTLFLLLFEITGETPQNITVYFL